jgi:O-antigen ligase
VRVVGACFLAGFLIPQITKLEEQSLVVTSIFAIALVVVVLFSEKNFIDQLYGTYGRNTGLLTYLALSILFLVGINFYSIQMAQYLLISLIGTGVLNVAYGYFQWLNLDPINWNNKYNPIIGTLGNPNFLSAHLGFTSLAVTALILDKKIKMSFRSLMGLFLIASLLLVYKSDSIQGLAVFAIGFMIIFYLRFIKTNKLVSILYIAIGSIGIVVGFLGTLQIGPLAKLLYQESVTYRGDYWWAGIQMLIEKPLFGYGMDSYGDWYRNSRSIEAVTRRGPDVVSNSAHNVFIDIASNGGVVLLIAYLLIILLIFKSIFKIISKFKEYDVYAVSLIVVWIAYLVQSIISINQIGIVIWGWILGGAVIGHSNLLNEVAVSNAKKQVRENSSKFQSPALLAGLLGVAIAIWPLTKDANFRDALTSGSVSQVEKAALRFPNSTFHLDYASRVLAENEIYEVALKLAEASVLLNPQHFNGWKQILLSPIVSNERKAAALTNLKRIDPLNPELPSQ